MPTWRAHWTRGVRCRYRLTLKLFTLLRPPLDATPKLGGRWYVAVIGYALVLGVVFNDAPILVPRCRSPTLLEGERAPSADRDLSGQHVSEHHARLIEHLALEREGNILSL
jgi:hypothetical protein